MFDFLFGLYRKAQVPLILRIQNDILEKLRIRSGKLV